VFRSFGFGFGFGFTMMRDQLPQHGAGAGAQQLGATGAQQLGAGAQHVGSGAQHGCGQLGWQDLRSFRISRPENNFLRDPHGLQHGSGSQQTGAGAQQVGAGAQHGSGSQQTGSQQEDCFLKQPNKPASAD